MKRNLHIPIKPSQILAVLVVFTFFVSLPSCKGKKTAEGLDKCGIWTLEYAVNDFGDTTGVNALSSSILEGLYRHDEPNVVTNKRIIREGKAVMVFGVAQPKKLAYDIPVFRLSSSPDEEGLPIQPSQNYDKGSMKIRMEKGDSIVCENLSFGPASVFIINENEAKTIISMLKKESAGTFEFRLHGTIGNYVNFNTNYSFTVTEEQMSGFNKVYINYLKKCIPID